MGVKEATIALSLVKRMLPGASPMLRLDQLGLIRPVSTSAATMGFPSGLQASLHARSFSLSGLIHQQLRPPHTTAHGGHCCSPPQLRTFASTTRSATQKADPIVSTDAEAKLRVRFAKVFVFIMLAGVGVRIVPGLSQSSIPHAVTLLDAKEAIFLKSGISRVQKQLQGQGSFQKVIEAGAVPKLLHIVQQAESADDGVLEAALNALHQVSSEPSGRLAIEQAEGLPILHRTLAEASKHEDEPSRRAAMKAAKLIHGLPVPMAQS